MGERAYTPEEARELIASEERADVLRRQIQRDECREQQRERRLYFARQRFYGLIITVVSILLLILTGNFSYLILAVFGVYIMRTRKMIIYNDYFVQHNGAEQWR